MAFLSVWGVLGSRRKFSQAAQKDWIELRKWRCFYVTQKSPWLEGKRSRRSKGSPLTVRLVHVIHQYKIITGVLFMFAVRETSSDLSVLHIPEFCTWNISLESTLLDLPLYNRQIELTQKAKEVALAFEENSMLPGVILTDRGNLDR